ncbi:MAG TPA: hypothetical protein VH063_16220 [Gaiellaceae bacterium]|jgi:hypothetical protein|nr:hypothetical protein [Gaiellaceae bacterium]
MGGLRRRRTEVAVFALLALVAELTGRSITLRLDGRLHVSPLATSVAPYYPFLLAGIRLLAALALAAVAWRLVRAHATAGAGEALMRTLGQRGYSAPRLRITLSPKLWLASFSATSLWFLVQDDGNRASEGRWPLLAPWLHTWALPVFAVLAVLFSIGWGAVRNWLRDVENYAAATFALACRALRRQAPEPSHHRPCDASAPRRLFGVVFESRPPPLPA